MGTPKTPESSQRNWNTGKVLAHSGCLPKELKEFPLDLGALDLGPVVRRQTFMEAERDKSHPGSANYLTPGHLGLHMWKMETILATREGCREE